MAEYESFATEEQIAEFLKVSERTLQRWRVEPPPGGGPRFYRLGRRIMYKFSEVERWAEARACESTAEANRHFR